MIRSEEGYSLIEALCAFAILSVVLMALYAATGPSLRGLAQSGETDKAILLARSKLAELQATQAPLPASAMGSFHGTDVIWRVDAHDMGRERTSMRFTVQELRLTLVWPGFARKSQLELAARHLARAAP